MAATLEKIRLNLEIPKKLRGQIEDLVNRSTCANITELIRRAIALYDLVLEHSHHGGEIVFRHESGKEEILRIL